MVLRLFQGLCWVFLECHAFIVFFQAEILDKHLMLLLATSTTKMKGEQIPRTEYKGVIWSLFAEYTIFPYLGRLVLLLHFVVFRGFLREELLLLPLG